MSVDVVVRLQKKRRNLEKKKNRIETMKRAELCGEQVNNESLTRYNAVLSQIELINDLLANIELDASKSKLDGKQNEQTDLVNVRPINFSFKSTQTDGTYVQQCLLMFMLRERFTRVLQCFAMQDVRNMVDENKDPHISGNDLRMLDEVAGILLPNASNDRVYLDKQLAGKRCSSYLEDTDKTYNDWCQVLCCSEILLTQELNARQVHDLITKFENSHLFKEWIFPNWKHSDDYGITATTTSNIASINSHTLQHSLEALPNAKDQQFVTSLLNGSPYSFFQPIETHCREEAGIVNGVQSCINYDQFAGHNANILQSHVPFDNVDMITYGNNDVNRLPKNLDISNHGHVNQPNWSSAAADYQEADDSVVTLPKQEIEGAKSWASIVGPSTNRQESGDVFSRAGMWKNPEKSEIGGGAGGTASAALPFEKKVGRGGNCSRPYYKGNNRRCFQSQRGRGGGTAAYKYQNRVCLS